MDFNEALSHAKQMGNRARAFAKIEEVLCVASLAEQATREAEAERVEVKKEIARLSGEKGRLKTEVAELEQGSQASQGKNDLLRDAMADERNKQVKELDAAWLRAVKTHDEAIKDLEADLGKKKVTALEELDELHDMKVESRYELSELREKMSALKSYVLGASGDKEQVDG